MVGIMKAWLGLFSGAASEIFAGLILRGDPGSGPKTLLFLLFSAGFVFFCSVAVSPLYLRIRKMSGTPVHLPQYVAFLLGLLAIMCALIAASVFSAYTPGGTLLRCHSLLALSYVMPLATCFGRADIKSNQLLIAEQTLFCQNP